MFYFFVFTVTFLISFLLTLAVRFFANRLKIIEPARKVPLFGGVAIFLSFFLVLGYFCFFDKRLWLGNILPEHIIGVLIAGFLIMIGGYLDDKYNLKPGWQIIWPVAAAATVILSGISVKILTNPWGGVFQLSAAVGGLIAFFWLLGMAYTTKFLDGLDGLVAGITAVGALNIFFFSLFTKYFQSDVALAALIFVASLLGFLVLNFYPAKIFLGEGGSLLAGFMLGVLAIISGAKIAITLSVVGIAVFDVVWVILRRIFWERRWPTQADKKHLHFRLLNIGLSHRQTAIFFYCWAALFGTLSIFLPSRGKVLVLGILGIAALAIAGLTVGMKKRHFIQ